MGIVLTVLENRYIYLMIFCCYCCCWIVLLMLLADVNRKQLRCGCQFQFTRYYIPLLYGTVECSCNFLCVSEHWWF